MHNGSLKCKLGSFVVVWCMVFSLFAGLMVVSAPNVVKALPSILPNGDITIGSGYDLTSWQISNSTYYMDGNLTITSGGIVTVTNAGISFTQDTGIDKNPNTLPNHIYTLIIENGGKLILNNSTLTTELNQIYDFPSLGVLVRNGGSLQALDNSTIEFPGHMVFDNASFVLQDSMITGHPSGMISLYCNSTYFPASVFSYSPVLYFSDSSVQMFDSKIMDIYEGGAGTVGIFNHNYFFARDTAARNTVTYQIQGAPVVRNSYRNVTIDNGTQFTAINSHIDVNFLHPKDSPMHNVLVLNGNSRAYLYGVDANTIVDSDREPAYWTNDSNSIIYIYRWAEVGVQDEQNLPVQGAIINATFQVNGTKAYYVSSAGMSPTPPSEVLQYLRKIIIQFYPNRNRWQGDAPTPIRIHKPRVFAKFPSLG